MSAKKHWLYISGGIGFAFIIFAWWLSAGAEAEELRRQNQMERAEIERLIERLKARERLLAEQKFLKENAPKMMGAIEFKLDFPKQPEDIGVEMFVKDELQKRRRALNKRVKELALRNPALKYTSEWDLENRIKNRMTRAEVEEMKARIVATDYLIRRALDAGVVRIRSVAQNQHIEEPLPKLGRVIERFPFTVKMSTKQDSLITLLFNITLKEKFLQILTLHIEPDVHAEGLLDVTLTVSVVRMGRIRPEEETSVTRRPPKRKPRRRRRRY